MSIYPISIGSVPSTNKIDKPVEKTLDSQISTAKKADYLKNQLAALAILGASLIGAGGLTSCSDDSFLDEIPITEVSAPESQFVKQSLESNIENICNNLNIEMGINMYGKNVSCNKITYPDGSYDEVYSQRNTSIDSNDIYTNGLVIHRNIPQNSPYSNLNDTGVKYIQKITQDEEGNINIVRKYDNNDDINNIKKGDIESITISAQDDGSYLCKRVSQNGSITTERMYNNGTNSFIGNSVIEPYSSHTNGKMPIPISFNPTVEDWVDI